MSSQFTLARTLPGLLLLALVLGSPAAALGGDLQVTCAGGRIEVNARQARVGQLLERLAACSGVAIAAPERIKARLISAGPLSAPAQDLAGLLSRLGLGNYALTLRGGRLARVDITGDDGAAPARRQGMAAKAGPSPAEARVLGAAAGPGRPRLAWMPPRPSDPTPASVPGELILALRPGATTVQALGAVEEIGLTPMGDPQLARLGYLRVRLEPGASLGAVVERLRASRLFGAAEPNYLVQATEPEPEAEADPAEAPDLGPPWHLAALGLDPAAVVAAPPGEPILVAVIDSGVDPRHPQLSDALVPGQDLIRGGEVVDDPAGHGTFVIGIIVALRDGQGAEGLAPGVRVVPYRVLDQEGSGNSADLARALVMAAERGARVINLSLAGPADSGLVRRAVAYAQDQGALVVAAAGNSGDGTVFFPAALPGVVAVGALGRDGQVWTLSSRGSHLGLAAPGEAILSTRPGGGETLSSGTSAAAPMVAALAALVWTARPDFTPEQVLKRLSLTAQDLAPRGRDELHGWGLISFKALEGL